MKDCTSERMVLGIGVRNVEEMEGWNKMKLVLFIYLLPPFF